MAGFGANRFFLCLPRGYQADPGLLYAVVCGEAIQSKLGMALDHEPF